MFIMLLLTFYRDLLITVKTCAFCFGIGAKFMCTVICYLVSFYTAYYFPLNFNRFGTLS